MPECALAAQMRESTWTARAQVTVSLRSPSPSPFQSCMLSPVARLCHERCSVCLCCHKSLLRTRASLCPHDSLAPQNDHVIQAYLPQVPMSFCACLSLSPAMASRIQLYCRSPQRCPCLILPVYALALIVSVHSAMSGAPPCPARGDRMCLC